MVCSVETINSHLVRWIPVLSSLSHKNKSEVSLVFMWTTCWEEVMKYLMQPSQMSIVSSILARGMSEP